MKEDCILRIPDVVSTTGLARTTIYRLVSNGEFPPPVKISVRAVGWRHSEIQEWIKNRSLAIENRKIRGLAAKILNGEA